MRRVLTLALCLAAADAGLRIGKPSGAGALKMATREEEKKAKEERRAKRKAAMSKDPEQARKELKERLAGYGTGEARARKYMQIARTKKFGMSDEEFAKQQQTYGRVAMDEAQMEMRRRAEKARDAVETQRIKENRSRVFRRVTGRAAKATDPVDADPTLAPVAVAADGSAIVAPRSTRLSPAAKKVLKKQFATFDAAKAECFLPEDKHRLLAVVEAGFGDFKEFNQLVRSSLLEAVVEDVPKAHVKPWRRLRPALFLRRMGNLQETRKTHVQPEEKYEVTWVEAFDSTPSAGAALASSAAPATAKVAPAPPA